MPKPQLTNYSDAVKKRFEDLVKRGLKRKGDFRDGGAEEGVGASEHSDGVAERSDDILDQKDGASVKTDDASEHIYAVTEHDHPGGGFKGYGKGNFGTVLPVPSSMVTSSDASLPIPYARFPEASEVEGWINEYFEPLSSTEGGSPRKGDVVLWRGFKTGRHGGNSTAVEYFRGEVHEIIHTGDETFYSVS